MRNHRLTHYLLLIGAMTVLTLPNLGVASFWDVDEGINAEAAREMLEAGTLLTPLFNFELRTAKPVMIYWLQMASYSIFGINEFAARLPSALAGMGTVLLVYELSRRMFSAATGLLAGLVLGSALEFCIVSHAATPDAVLLFFTVLGFYSFWLGSCDGRRGWFIPCGFATGLAMLTKGPVGLVLPAAVIFCYFLWNRELKRLVDWRVILGAFTFILVAAPWYILVSVETRGVWIKQFLGQENLTRFTQPMESHSGPIFYHLLGLLILFAPWSIFLVAIVIHSARQIRSEADVRSTSNEECRAHRFLVCWIGVYLIFFSIAATKLPNYVLPVYPALAILTARILDRWRSGVPTIPAWTMPGAVISFGAVGFLIGLGLALASGVIPLPLKRMQVFPGLADWIWIGLVPLAGAAAARWYLDKQRRVQVINAMTIAAVAFTSLLAAFVNAAFDPHKAPRELVQQAHLRQNDHDMRLLSLQWFQPSLVFYSQREVEKLTSAEEALGYLAMRHPVYLFVPEPVWESITDRRVQGFRTVARSLDFQKNCAILVITNQAN